MKLESPNNLPDRGRPAHQPIHGNGNKSIIVFVTVCVDHRRPVLATPEMHELVQASWRKADVWLVGRYVLMPDHIHLFCAPGTNPPESLTRWIAYWKRLVAFGVCGSFWQKNFWDTQLRRGDSYSAKWDYVRNNPVRAGLVSDPARWPYQGEMNLLRWHD
jgi:putative transposase